MQNAHQWVEHVLDVLFAPDKKRLGSIISELNDKNSSIRGSRYFGFMHHGSRFLDPRYKTQAKVLATYPMPTLSMELNAQVKQFDKDCDVLQRDREKIKQALVPLLINCIDMQDIRDCLPDCVAALIPELASIPRKILDPTEKIRSDVYAVKAYKKSVPLMEAYSVAALIL